MNLQKWLEIVLVKTNYQIVISLIVSFALFYWIVHKPVLDELNSINGQLKTMTKLFEILVEANSK
jgi:hypothetical protein